MDRFDDTTHGDLGLSLDESLLQTRRTSTSLCDLTHNDSNSCTLHGRNSLESLLCSIERKSCAPPGPPQLDRSASEETSLQNELDICRRLLNAKYLAANILLRQLLNKEKEEQRRSERERETNVLREVNSLQYELQCMEDHLQRSQQTWLDKLTRLAEENAENQAKVRTQGELIRELTYKVQVLRREREELLTLLDVKERAVYLQSCAAIVQGACQASFLEVAVLAACVCRGPKQEPCRCAHAAAYKQRQLHSNMEKIKQLEAQVKDANKTLEIYREAFEIQLARNRQLMRQVTQLQSKKDLLALITPKSKCCHPQKGIIDDLVEKLCDKNEALVHQQLMLKLLAQQISKTELETAAHVS